MCQFQISNNLRRETNIGGIAAHDGRATLRAAGPWDGISAHNSLELSEESRFSDDHLPMAVQVVFPSLSVEQQYGVLLLPHMLLWLTTVAVGFAGSVGFVGFGGLGTARPMDARMAMTPKYFIQCILLG